VLHSGTVWQRKGRLRCSEAFTACPSHLLWAIIKIDSLRTIHARRSKRMETTHFRLGRNVAGAPRERICGPAATLLVRMANTEAEHAKQIGSARLGDGAIQHDPRVAESARENVKAKVDQSCGLGE